MGVPRRQMEIFTQKLSRLLAFYPILMLACSEIRPQEVVTTIAGNRTDVGDAVVPFYIAIDPQGNVIFTDLNAIRRIDRSTQAVTTIAGIPALTTIAGIMSKVMPGFSGDGGLASNAQINNPRGIATDLSGNIFFVDAGNNRIRRIDAFTGIISTVAGNGVVGFSGDGASNFRFDGYPSA